MDKNQIMRPLLWRGVLLFAGVALLLMADFALAAGTTGTVVWAILSVADVAAVSYTHLDVYKRQVQIGVPYAEVFEAPRIVL